MKRKTIVLALAVLVANLVVCSTFGQASLPATADTHAMVTPRAPVCPNSTLLSVDSSGEGKGEVSEASAAVSTWAAAYGGSAYEFLQDMIITSDGGMLFIASSSFLQGTDTYTCWVVKTYPSGSIAWQKAFRTKYGATFYGVAEAPDGAFLIAGETWQEEPWGPAAWILKLSPDGSVLRDLVLVAENGAGLALDYDIHPTSDGGYVLLASTRISGGGAWIPWVVKMNSDFTIQWQRQYYDGEVSYARHILPTSDGGYLVAGGWVSPNYPVWNQPWIFKLDGGGNIVWQRAFEDASNGDAYAAVETPDGGFVVVGTVSKPGSAAHYAWIARLRSNGAVDWHRMYGETHGAVTDSATSAYCIRSVGDDTYLVGGYGSAYPDYLSAFWLGRIDGTGSFLWQKAYKQDTSFGALALGTTGAGEILLGGNRFDPGLMTQDFLLTVDSNGTMNVACDFAQASLFSVDADPKIVRTTTAVSSPSPHVGGYLSGYREIATPVDVVMICTDACFVSCSASADPFSGDPPLSVQFTLSASPNANCSGSPSAHWDFGDGETSSEMNPTHIYLNPGSYTWIAKATVDDFTCTKSGTIDVGCYLTCALDTPDWGVAGLPVTFTSRVAPSASCTGTPSYLWDFGDGGSSSLESPSHTYTVAGTFSWSFLAALGGITCSETGSVVVNDCSLACTATVPPSAHTGAEVAFSGWGSPSGCVGVPRYAWDFGDGSTSLERNPTHTYTAAKTYDWKLTVTADGAICTQTGSIEVGECTITCGASVPTEDAVDRPVLFEATASITQWCTQSVRFDWDFGDGTTALGASYLHTYDAPGTYNWTLTATVDGLTCQQKGSIKIWPKLTISPSAIPMEGSTPLMVAFQDDVSGGKPKEEWPYYTVTWVFGDGGSAEVRNPLKIYFLPGVYLVQVTAKDELGQEATGSLTITVSQGPSCGVGGVRLNKAAEAGALPMVPPASVNAALDKRASAGDSPSASAVRGEDYTCLSVQLLASPEKGAYPLDITFTAVVAGGIGPYTFYWNYGEPEVPWFYSTGSPTEVHTYKEDPGKGTYTATVIVVDSEYHPFFATTTVTIADPMSVVISATNTTGKTPVSVLYSAEITGGLEPFNYVWDFGDGNSSADAGPSHTYLIGGTYQATLTLSDSAGQRVVSDPVTLEFSQGLVALPTASPTSGLAPLSVQFRGSALGGAPPYSYSWAFGDLQYSSEQNPGHTYTSAGTYQAILTVKDSLNHYQSSEPLTIYATAPLVAEASASPVQGSAPLDVLFHATIAGGLAPYTITWDFGDGSTGVGESPQHTYEANGTYPVILRVVDAEGLSATDSHLTVYATDCAVTCSATVPQEGEAGIPVAFASSATLTPECLQAVRFDWDFGDGVTRVGQNAEHIYSVDGDYTWTLTATVGAITCVQTGTIHIYPRLSIVVTAYPEAGTTPLLTVLSASVSGGKPADEGTIPSYTCAWDFKDGTTASPYQAYLKTYVTTGIYEVTVTAMDSLGVTISGHVTVTVQQGPPCGIGITPMLSLQGKEGEPSFIPLEAASLPEAMPLRLSAEAIRHLEASRAAENDDYTCMDVSLSANPALGPIPFETDLTVSITGGSAPYRYYWNTGEPDQLWYNQGPGPIYPYTYEETGTYTPKVMVVDSYFHPFTTSTTVRAVDPLSVLITATNTTGTTPVTVLFGSFVTGGVEPFTYAWDLGNGASSTEASPTLVYLAGGTYTVTLKVTDSVGQVVISDPITLEFEQGLVAIASASPTAGTAPLEVVFHGSALGGEGSYTYLWKFGDGANSDQKDAVHIYASMGVFQATLTVRDRLGNSQESSPIAIHVNAPLVAQASATPTSGLSPLAVAFTASQTGGMEPYSYAWDFGDGTSGTGATVSHTYAGSGNFHVILKVVDGAGIVATDSHLFIGVALPLAVSVTATPATGSEPLSVQFAAVISGGLPPLAYSWDFGDQSPADTSSSPTHIYSQFGTYAAKLTVKDSIEQTATGEVSISVGNIQPSLLWRYTANTQLLHLPTVGVDGSAFVAGSNAYIYALTPSGGLLWKKKPGGAVMAPMAYERGVLYFPTSNQRLMAYSADGGKMWELKLEANAVSSPALSGCGTVYIGSTDGTLYAVSTSGGLIWKFKAAGPIESTPAVGQDGTIYVVANASSAPDYFATLYAIKPSGSLKWESAAILESTVTLPLVLDGDDNIYVTDTAGTLTVVPPSRTTPAPNPRAILWSASTGSASPVIAQDLLLFSDGGATGNSRHLRRVQRTLVGRGGIAILPAISADGKAYVIQNNGQGQGGYLVVLSMRDGAILSTTRLSGGGRDPVLLSLNDKGRIYTITADCNVECYAVPKGAAVGPWAQYGASPYHPARRNEAPTAFITSPASGASVSGSVSINFGGTISLGCDAPKVSLYIAGYKMTTANVSPASFLWLTGASQSGQYTITAECVDKAGVVATSSISVFLDNPEPPTYSPSDPIPTFSWQPSGDTKFRVYLSTDPEFATVLVTSKTADKPWLKSAGWTPSGKQWDKVLATAGASPVAVYWKVIGKEAGMVQLGRFYVTH